MCHFKIASWMQILGTLVYVKYAYTCVLKKIPHKPTDYGKGASLWRHWPSKMTTLPGSKPPRIGPLFNLLSHNWWTMRSFGYNHRGKHSVISYKASKVDFIKKVCWIWRTCSNPLMSRSNKDVYNMRWTPYLEPK